MALNQGALWVGPVPCGYWMHYWGRPLGSADILPEKTEGLLAFMPISAVVPKTGYYAQLVAVVPKTGYCAS